MIRKPSNLQERVLLALAEDDCRIRMSFTDCVLVDRNSRLIHNVKRYTVQALIRESWIQIDQENVKLWRISERGRKALFRRGKREGGAYEFFRAAKG